MLHEAVIPNGGLEQLTGNSETAKDILHGEADIKAGTLYGGASLVWGNFSPIPVGGQAVPNAEP